MTGKAELQEHSLDEQVEYLNARLEELAAASEWIYTGEVYSAQTAQALGLVREVIAATDLRARVNEVADLIARRGPLAVRAAKRVISAGMATDARAAATMEPETSAELFATEDTREGTAAFTQKRDPNFKGI